MNLDFKKDRFLIDADILSFLIQKENRKKLNTNTTVQSNILHFKKIFEKTEGYIYNFEKLEEDITNLRSGVDNGIIDRECSFFDSVNNMFPKTDDNRWSYLNLSHGAEIEDNGEDWDALFISDNSTKVKESALKFSESRNNISFFLSDLINPKSDFYLLTLNEFPFEKKQYDPYNFFLPNNHHSDFYIIYDAYLLGEGRRLLSCDYEGDPLINYNILEKFDDFKFQARAYQKKSKYSGIVNFTNNFNFIESSDKNGFIFFKCESTDSKILIKNDQDEVIEEIEIPFGARVLVKNGDKISKNTALYYSNVETKAITFQKNQILKGHSEAHIDIINSIKEFNDNDENHHIWIEKGRVQYRSEEGELFFTIRNHLCFYIDWIYECFKKNKSKELPTIYFSGRKFSFSNEKVEKIQKSFIDRILKSKEKNPSLKNLKRFFKEDKIKFIWFSNKEYENNKYLHANIILTSYGLTSWDLRRDLWDKELYKNNSFEHHCTLDKKSRNNYNIFNSFLNHDIFIDGKLEMPYTFLNTEFAKTNKFFRDKIKKSEKNTLQNN